MMISTWHSCLEDLDYKLCGMAVKKCMIQNKYPPTIHEIRKSVIEIIETKSEDIDYWNEAYNMISNGIYMTLEEFESHSKTAKRYFGSLNRLKRKSMTDNLNLEVEQSLFNQYVKNIQSENFKEKLLPIEFKSMINQLSDKLKLSN